MSGGRPSSRLPGEGGSNDPNDPGDPVGPPATSGLDDAAPAAARLDPAGVDPGRALLARARASARSASRTPTRKPAGRRRSGTDGGSRSGSGPDDRDPQPLGVAVDRLTADHGWEVDVAVHAVLARWSELVGDDLAAHCRPEGFDDGTLTVRAESTAWATQLRLLAPQLVARLNSQVGSGTVRLVTIRGPDAPRWTHGPRSVRGRGPRDTYG